MDNNSWVWILVAVVLIAVLVFWLASNSKKRRQEEQRSQAEAIRQQVEADQGRVTAAVDRASVASSIAGEARAEADDAAARAAELEKAAKAHQEQAKAAADDLEARTREADRLDPDVRTDDEGYRLDDSGARIPGTAAGVAGVGGAALGGAALTGADDDDEQDLADAENPFAQPADSPTTSPEEAYDDERSEIEADAGAVDRDPDLPAWVDTRGVEEVAAERDDATAAPEYPENAAMVADDGYVTDETPVADDTEYEGQTEDPFREDTSRDDDAAAADDRNDEEYASRPRQYSEPDEVVDGGYGVGSAAPIFDGAQPFGHAVKAWNDTRTFVSPDAPGYADASPDVWFYSDEAAEAAGFSRAEGS